MNTSLSDFYLDNYVAPVAPSKKQQMVTEGYKGPTDQYGAPIKKGKNKGKAKAKANKPMKSKQKVEESNFDYIVRGILNEEFDDEKFTDDAEQDFADEFGGEEDTSTDFGDETSLDEGELDMGGEDEFGGEEEGMGETVSVDKAKLQELHSLLGELLGIDSGLGDEAGLDLDEDELDMGGEDEFGGEEDEFGGEEDEFGGEEDEGWGDEEDEDEDVFESVHTGGTDTRDGKAKPQKQNPFVGKSGNVNKTTGKTKFQPGKQGTGKAKTPAGQAHDGKPKPQGKSSFVSGSGQANKGSGKVNAKPSVGTNSDLF